MQLAGEDALEEDEDFENNLLRGNDKFCNGELDTTLFGRYLAVLNEDEHPNICKFLRTIYALYEVDREDGGSQRLCIERVMAMGIILSKSSDSCISTSLRKRLHHI
jgi:hypothetical protein